MSLNQTLGGGDFITTPKEKPEQTEQKKSIFFDQMDVIRKDLSVEEHRVTIYQYFIS